MTISLDDAKSVAYLYEASLNRQADLGGLNFWIDVVESSGYSLPQLAQAFLDSNEYAQNFGDPDEQTNEEFVEILYNNILGRVSDPAGFDFWTGVLENGTPKNELLLLFAVATENKAASPYIDTLSEGLGGNYYFASDGKDDPDLIFDDNDGKVGIETVAVTSDVSVQTTESAGIINLDDFLADPQFDGIDGHGMTTVIIDTGIDLNHSAFGPDLDGNGVSDRIIYSQDFTQDGDGTADDVQGHGSNVASIVAGSDPNFEGMAPAANIIALQGLGNDGSGDFGWIEKALQWVVANAVAYNIVSVNMSLGDSTNVSVPGPNPSGLADELAALNNLGVITVAAAGNSYFDYQTEGASSLAADPNVIAVGAVWDGAFGKVSFASGAEDTTTGVDRITSFSQRSTALPTIFAPGGFIEGAAPGGGTVSMAGTSQAAPHIAGIAVLAQQLAEQELGRRLTPDEFAQLLLDTGDTIFDGDDEQDNVANTNANYRRVDVHALATAIVELGGGGGTNPPPSDIAGDASTDANLGIGASAGSDLGFALDSDWFRVTLEAGDAYDFGLLGTALGNGTLVDPYLRLRDGFGNIVAYDDDSGSGLDSLIDDFVPTAGGTYYLDAGAYSNGTGTYTIVTSTTGAQSNEIAENTGTNANLAVGNSLVSALDFDNDHDWVRVSLTAGETYQIDLRGAPSGAGTIADPYLNVYDANGNPVAANDDGGEGFDSQLFFTPTVTGSYYLSAGSFRASDIGTYELSVTELNTGDIPGSTQTFAEIQPDQSTTSDLAFLGDTDWFAFFAFAGQQFQIDLDGAGGNPLSDPLLRVYDSNGSQVGYDDDSGPDLNSSLAFSVQSDGWYYLSAEAYGNARTGGYEISVTSTGFDVPDGFGTSVQIQPGQSFVSTIDVAGDHDWYILDVEAGNEYAFFLEGTGEAGELSDPLLRVYDQNGFQVAANDDSGGTRDSFIDFFAEFDERLYLSAEAYANSGTGDYYITVV